jgi:high-affinity nickel-transport protein
VGSFNINRAGFAIAGLFVVTWVAAIAIWRWGNLEKRWQSMMVPVEAPASVAGTTSVQSTKGAS